MQGSQSQSWNHEEIILGVTLFIILSGVVWMTFGKHWQHEMKVVAVYMLYPFALIFPWARNDYMSLIQNHSPLWNSLTKIGWWYRFILVPALSIPTGVIWFRSVRRKYSHKMTLKSLLWHHANNFPSGLPAARAMMAGRIDFEPRDSGPWARSLTPNELREKAVLLAKKASSGVPTEEQIDDALRGLLERQLGRRIERAKDFRFHERCLIACFLHFITGTRDEGNQILDDLSRGFREREDSETGKIQLPIDPVRITSIMKAKIGVLNGYIAKHAWSTTIIMAMLDDARRRGMLPPAKFLWLKPTDRYLWYALHQMPAPLPGERLRHKRIVSEAAGSACHYKAEVIAEGRIDFPVIETAFAGIMREIEEWKWDPELGKGKNEKDRQERIWSMISKLTEQGG